DAAGTAGALSVSVQGQGVKALVLGDDSTASGEPTALNGKLISGPGGCFALQPGGQPELLLVGDDVEGIPQQCSQGAADTAWVLQD
uniref:hypothetical protein n=1 Tax=Micrococcus terreus TaxID=574650 RepID=UPI0023F8DD4D